MTMTSKSSTPTPPPGQYLALQLRAKESADGGPLVITGIANDANTTDSYGTRIKVSQRALDGFMENPILLMNHDVHNPIGTVRSIGYMNGQLRAEAEIHPDAKTLTGASIADLVRSKVLRAFSVRIDECTETRQKDYTQLDADVLDELSIVTLPSNRPSLFQMRGKGIQIHGAEELIMEEETEETATVRPADLRSKDSTRAAGPLSLDLLQQRLASLIRESKGDSEWYSSAYLVAVYDEFCVWSEYGEASFYRQGYTVDATGAVALSGAEQEVLPQWTVVGGTDDENIEDTSARALADGYSVTRTLKLGDAEQTVTVRLKSLEEVERFSRLADSRPAPTPDPTPDPEPSEEFTLEQVRLAIRLAAAPPNPQ